MYMWQALIRVRIGFKEVILAADMWARADPRNKIMISLSPQCFLGRFQRCFYDRTGYGSADMLANASGTHKFELAVGLSSICALNTVGA